MQDRRVVVEVGDQHKLSHAGREGAMQGFGVARIQPQQCSPISFPSQDTRCWCSLMKLSISSAKGSVMLP
jgi:hypothetical protein